MGYMNGTLPTLFQTALTLTQYPYYNLLAEIYNTYVGLRQLTQKATGPLFNPSVHFAAGAAAGSVPTESIEPQVGSNLASTDLDEEATDLDEGGAETQPTVSPAHHQPQKEPFFSQAQLDYIRNHPELTPEAIYNAFRTGKKKGLGFTDPQKRLGKCEKRMMGVQSKILELKR